MVRMGEVEIYKETSENLLDVEISEIIVHPDYKPPRTYHDIALLRLKESVKWVIFKHIIFIVRSQKYVFAIFPKIFRWYHENNIFKLLISTTEKGHLVEILFIYTKNLKI